MTLISHKAKSPGKQYKEVVMSRLVLLFGMPRSGTTWIGKLFDSHKDTYYLHEPDSVMPDYEMPLLMGETCQPNRLSQHVKTWLSPDSEKVIASRPFFNKSYLGFLPWRLFLFTAYACKLTARLGLPFMRRPLRIQSKPPVLVWKSIESLGRLPALHLTSNTISIHIMRHPCGQIASTLRGEEMAQFDGSLISSQDWDLFEKLLKQSGETRFSLQQIKAMTPEERLTLRWGIINDYALQIQASEKAVVLIYEDLCRDPKGQLTELFNKVGLELAEQTSQYLDQSTQGEDKAYYATRKNPLVAAYKWREQLTPAQQQRIALMMSHFKSAAYYADDF
jgi:hypothetical protein